MTKRSVLVGAVAGAIGGMMMAMWSMIAFALTSKGFWTPVNLIAHSLWSGAPLTGEFSGGAFALGLVAHMALAMMLGAVISVVAHLVAKGGASTVAIATAIALGAWVIQAFLWRAVDSAGSAAFTPWILAVGHVIFGMSAGAVIVTSERKAHIPESERSLPAFERAA